MEQPAPWRRPGILVGRPFAEMKPSDRALLLAAVCVLAGRDPDELETQLTLASRAGAQRRRLVP